MILLSVTHNGIDQTNYDLLSNMFVLTYGYPEMITIMNLADAGLFKVQAKNNPWDMEKIIDALKLVDEKQQKKGVISYVFTGLKPILVRVIEMLMK